jgi:polar amino acid transport system substrate-binding protein
MFVENGQYEGIDFEFLQAATNQLHCEIIVDVLPEKRAHRELAGGNSIVMTGATISEERLKYTYFSQPYRAEVISLFYLKQQRFPDKITDLAFLINNRHTIVTNGAAYYGPSIESYRKSEHSGKFLHVPSVESRVKMLTRKRAEGMVEDHIAGCSYFHQNAPLFSKDLRAITVNKVEVAFMFNKVTATPAFIDLFNKTMNDLLKQGILDDLVTQYSAVGC